MGKYDGYLICSDLDGTFTNHEGIITKETTEAVRYFQSEGGKFTFATGRLPYYIDTLKEYVIPNAPLISVNGACIYDMKEEKYLRITKLPEIAYEIIYDFCERYYYKLERFYLNSQDSFTDVIPDGKFSTVEIDKHIDKSDYWCKVVFSCKDGDSALKLQKELVENDDYNQKLYFPRSWITGLEVLSIEATKGNAVNFLKEMDRGIHTTIAVGDFENDISMIQMADIGYAVDNAPEHVKAKAKNLTVSNEFNPIAKIIYELA